MASSRSWPMLMLFSCVVFFGLSAIVLAGCGSRPSRPASGELLAPAIGNAEKACSEGAQGWRTGEAKYPPTMIIKINGSASYNFAVGIEGGQLVPDQVLPPGTYSNTPVDVKCVLAANLQSGDDGLAVAGGDWQVRQFTPTGVVQWTWSVTANKPGSHDLRVQLQPAVVLNANQYGVPVGGGTEISTFVTKVDVNTPFPQSFYLWWGANWPNIVTISSAIGVTLLGLRTFYKKLRAPDVKEKDVQNT